MNTETAKAVVAEWLDERTLPSLTLRTVDVPDVSRCSDVIAIVGPRRAGKTFLMYQIMKELISNAKCRKSDILFLDFEDYRFSDFVPSDIETLFAAHVHLTGDAPRFLFLDEVQNMPQWSKVVRTLHGRGRYRLVISGSNAKLLSRELSTELRGRAREVRVLPFSFEETLRFRNIAWTERAFYTTRSGALMREFDRYLESGGYPDVVAARHTTEQRGILQGYLKTVFYRDILERHNIRAKHVLDAMMRYILDTYGTLFSISAFEKVLKRHGESGSKRTIANYLRYLNEAFFIVGLEKCAWSPRVRLMNPLKTYLIDTGFALLSTAFSENKGRALENLVAIELMRRGVDSYYSRNGYECDFVTKSGMAFDTAIQVCWELNERNQARELRGLAKTRREFDIPAGLVLTYNQDEELDCNGTSVRLKPVWKWLLEAQRSTVVMK